MMTMMFIEIHPLTHCTQGNEGQSRVHGTLKKKQRQKQKKLPTTM
jgi:hypothetical protein